MAETILVADLQPVAKPNLIWLCPADGNQLRRFDPALSQWVTVGGGGGGGGGIVVANDAPAPAPDLIWMCPKRGDRISRWDERMAVWVDVPGGNGMLDNGGPDSSPATIADGTLVSDVATPAVTFDDAGLTAGTEYSYSAFAHDYQLNYAAAAAVTTATTA